MEHREEEEFSVRQRKIRSRPEFQFWLHARSDPDKVHNRPARILIAVGKISRKIIIAAEISWHIYKIDFDLFFFDESNLFPRVPKAYSLFKH